MLHLFRQRKPKPPESIAEAVAVLSVSPSPENRNALYGQLLRGQLRLAARDVPQKWTDTVVVLKEATTISVLTSDAPDGTTAPLAFTSQAKLLERAPTAGSFAMNSRDVLKLVVAQGYGALVLDPNGPWAAVPRADIEALLGD